MANNLNPQQLGLLKNLAKAAPLFFGIGFLNKAVWKGKNISKIAKFNFRSRCW